MFKARLIFLLGFLVFFPVISSTAFAETEAGGEAVISDDEARSDAISYLLYDVPSPVPGKEYVGWLVSDDDSVKLSTGPMVLTEDGGIVHYFGAGSKRHTGENLIHNYSKVMVTMEAVGTDPDAPAGNTVFHHSIPLGGMAHIRHLLTKSPTGSDKGLIIELQDQIQVAIDHAVIAMNSKTLDDMRLHTHHVINLIEGSGGANFDSGAGVPSPGDDKGILFYASERVHAQLAVDEAAGDTSISTYGGLVLVAGTNAEDFAIQARDGALRSLKETDIAFAKLVLATVVGLLQSTLNGVDANGNGTVEFVAGEGAANQAYHAAQAMAGYVLEPGAPEPVVSVVPTATPAPAPVVEPTPVPPATGGNSIAPLAMALFAGGLMFLVLGGGFLVMNGRRSHVNG